MRLMIIILRLKMITNRDFEDGGPLSLPVTDGELQRQADSQILRFVLIIASHQKVYHIQVSSFEEVKNTLQTAFPQVFNKNLRPVD